MSQIAIQIHEIFPDTLSKAQVFSKIDRDCFHKFVVCQKYKFVLEYEDYVSGSSVVTCSYARFPKRSHQHMRAKCQGQLLKTVTTQERQFFAIFLAVNSNF